jgi:hypothetical protein
LLLLLLRTPVGGRGEACGTGGIILVVVILVFAVAVAVTVAGTAVR